MPGSGTVPSPRGLPPVAALHAALGVRRFSFSADHHAGTAEPFRVARPQAVVSNLNDQQITNVQAPGLTRGRCLCRLRKSLKRVVFQTTAERGGRSFADSASSRW